MNAIAAYLFVFAGGAVGALTRLGVQEGCRKWTSLPGWGAIFIVNILGSFCIGLAVAWLMGLESNFRFDGNNPLHRYVETQAAEHALSLLAVGFCGAFTTFSTFSLDNHFLYQNQRGRMAFNMVGSAVIALLAVLAGWQLGTWAAA